MRVTAKNKIYFCNRIISETFASAESTPVQRKMARSVILSIGLDTESRYRKVGAPQLSLTKYSRDRFPPVSLTKVVKLACNLVQVLRLFT